jgi:hypothetical protein
LIHSCYLTTIFAAKEPAPEPWPAAFGIITACNPLGQGIDAPKDTERTTQLRKAIARRGFERHRVTGMSLDWSHQEPGFAIWGCNQGDVVDLGSQFQQHAIFWIEQGRIEVISCTTGERQFVALWSERIRRWRDRPTCRIYVIRLDQSVAKVKRFRERNLHCSETTVCLYVGKTGKTPEERFAEHKRGYRSSSIVRKYGQNLIAELYQHLPLYSEAEGATMEVKYAETLRADGYGVWQN